MTSLPQKPLKARPPGVLLPEASRTLPSRRRGQSRPSSNGLLGSIGIHLVIALIAGAVVLTGQGSANKNIDKKTVKYIPQYEIRLASKYIPEIPAPAKIERPPTFFTSFRMPITVLPELTSTVVLPPSEPFQSVTAPQVAPPPSSTDSGKSAPPPSGTSTGHSP